MFLFFLLYSSLNCHWIKYISCEIYFTGGQVNKVAVKNFTNIPCVDVSGDIFNSEKGGLDPSLNTVEDIFDRKEKNSELEVSKQSNSTRHENRYHFKIDVHYYGRSEMKDIDGGVSSPEISQIGPSGSPSSVV